MPAAPPTIVGIGEILWDIFPDGPRFGGAPANFACHAASLCGRAWIVSAVGEDDLGDSAIETLRGKNVATDYIRRSSHPTGTVQVQINAAGQASYQFGTNEAWDHLEWSPELEELARRTDAVCFGTLSQRCPQSRELVQRFVNSVPAGSLRILDINLRPPFVDHEVIRQSLALANVLKLNDDELPVLSSLANPSRARQEAEVKSVVAARTPLPDGRGSETATIHAPPTSLVDQLQALAAQFQLQLIALTRGQAGAILIQGDRVSIADGIKVAVKDTVGAGDAYTAALAAGLLAQRDLDAVNRAACEIAAYVCTQSGGTPSLPRELCDRVIS